ncbi:MAG: glycosyltransferase family 4 protein [Thermomicrobiales bacterium]
MTACAPVTMLISSLGAGGAERVMATMAGHWAAEGRPVTLLTLRGETTPAFYDLHPAVDHRAIGGARPTRSVAAAAWQNGRRFWRTRNAVRASRPDVLVSFIDSTNVLAILVGKSLRIPVIVAEHTDPSQYSSGPIWNLLRSRLYPRADRVVVLSETVRDFFPTRLRAKIRVIPNPVVVQNRGAALDRASSGPERHVVALGRLSEEKRFDLLIRSFAATARDRPEWRLTIWGEGPERAKLEAVRSESGMAERIALPGATKEPHARLAEADLFVLCSRFEGFPMALCEAMAVGLPVIAVDCPSGPREIVRPGIDGVLTPLGDDGALRDAMARLMDDPAERARLALRAPEVLDRFGVERVMAVWDGLLAEVAACAD